MNSQKRMFAVLIGALNIIGFCGWNISAQPRISANVVNANHHFNVQGKRVLDADAASTYVGWDAGTLGIANSFYGASAGRRNLSGRNNSIFFTIY